MASGRFMVALVLLAALSGCIGTTRHTAATGGCPDALKAGSRVLVGEIPKLSVHRSYQLYQQLEQEFTRQGIRPAYTAEQEFELAQNGLKPYAAPDTANLEVMRKMGYTYYLLISVGNVASGTGYAHTSAQEVRELQTGYGTAEEDASQATVQFRLYSTLNKKAIYTQVTTTKLSGITIPKNQQEEGYRASGTVNLSTASMATERAIRKGAKELLENCDCCQ